MTISNKVLRRKQTLHKYNNSIKGKATQLRYRRTKKGKALSRRAKLKHYYNLTLSEYNTMFKKQKGQCAVCGRHQMSLNRRLDIDHDHATGKVRGLLCSVCNRHLGRVEHGCNYIAAWGKQMLQYLEKYKEIK